MASFVRSVTKAERSLVRQRTEVQTAQAKSAKAARRKRLQAVQDLMSTMAEKQDGVLERNFDEDEGTDPFEQLYGPNRLLTPPYSFERLYHIYEESDILQSCVDAMQNNIDGFGYKLLFLGDDVKDKDNPGAKTERVMLESFFNQVNEKQSMTTIRKLQREDLEVIGNGAYEVIRNLRNEVSMMYFAPFRRVRISALKGKPVTVEAPIKRNGKIIVVKIKKYFRKFAQLDGYGKTLRWFKEFGDPRTLDYRTGEYTDTRYKATELWHFKIPFGGMTYGLPRWIGALLQVMGRRSAHFVNYDLFENQGIPPMAIMVSGGTLTDDSLDELEALMNSAKGIEAFNRILLLESMMESTGLDEKGTAKIEMKNMTEYRREDMMFDKYLKGAKNDVRHVYRLPDLYVGQSETFCVSEDTETLTENGWKLYHEVVPGEKIATLHPETHNLEYHVPDNDGRPYVFDYYGPMIHFENKAIDQLVTPTHDMFISLRRGSHWFKRHANDIFKTDNPNYRVLLKTAPKNYDAASLKDVKIPIYQKRTDNIIGADVMEAELFLRLAGLYLGDGSSSTGESNYNITLSATKRRKIEIFKSVEALIVGLAGISVSSCTKGDGSYKVTISGRGLWEILRNEFGGSPSSKHLPDWMMCLGSKHSKIILEGLIATDGNVHSGIIRTSDISLPHACRLVSTSKTLIEQAQLLAFKCGFRAVIPEPWVKTNPRHADTYYLNLKRAEDVQLHNFQVEEIDYCGKVYCFNVQNHLFVIRRNGKIGITGNTHATAKAAQTVAEEQVFIPERGDFDEQLNLQLLRGEMKVTFWKIQTRGPRVVGAADISKAVQTFSAAGAFTVNHAIEQANEAFGLEMSKYDDDWANYPIPIVIELVKAGRLTGLDKIAEAADKTSGNISNQLPAPATPKLLPAPTQKMLKSDLFTEDEKSLYRLLVTIQAAIESGHFNCEIDDEGRADTCEAS